LQGLGAGLGGQLPQFLSQQNEREGLRQQDQMNQQAMMEKQQAMTLERQKTMFTDANAALQLLDSNNLDGVVQLGLQRLQALKQLSQFDPSIDPSDTQRVTRLALAARNGDEEAMTNLRGELANTVEIGKSIGVLEMPQDEIIPASAISPTGQVGFRSPSGAIRVEDMLNFKAEEKDRRVDFMQRVTPSGTIETVMVDPSGAFFDLQGKPIELGANERLIEGATLTGGTEDLGIGNAEARTMRDTEVAARSFVATTNDAIQLLNDEPNINTFAARAASIVNNLQQEGRAIASSLGMSFDEGILDPSAYSNQFDELGIQNQRMRSMITSLAFQAAAASGQSGRDVSNADVARFINEVGASASDPRAFARTLLDVAGRTDRRFRIDYETRLGKPFEGNLGTADLPGFKDSSAPAVTTQAEYDALQSGQRYTEDGREFIKP
jgi:hypothetical protein